MLPVGDKFSEGENKCQKPENQADQSQSKTYEVAHVEIGYLEAENCYEGQERSANAEAP